MPRISIVSAVAGGCGQRSSALNILGESVPPSSDVDGASATLGLKFYSTVPGNVIGARFYKIPGTPAGTRLAALYGVGLDTDAIRTANYDSETASGWQSQLFASPFHIDALQAYIIATYFPALVYGFTVAGLSGDIVNGPLVAPADGAVEGPPGVFDNALFLYGPDPARPVQGFDGTLYFVDVLFQPD